MQSGAYNFFRYQQIYRNILISTIIKEQLVLNHILRSITFSLSITKDHVIVRDIIKLFFNGSKLFISLLHPAFLTSDQIGN